MLSSTACANCRLAARGSVSCSCCITPECSGVMRLSAPARSSRPGSAWPRNDGASTNRSIWYSFGDLLGDPMVKRTLFALVALTLALQMLAASRLEKARPDAEEREGGGGVLGA